MFMCMLVPTLFLCCLKPVSPVFALICCAVRVCTYHFMFVYTYMNCGTVRDCLFLIVDQQSFKFNCI